MGLTHFLGDDAITASTRLGAASQSSKGYVTKANLDRSYFDLSAGLEIASTANFTFEASAFAGKPDNSDSYDALLGLKYRFRAF